MNTHLTRLADVLINYSTRVQPGEIVVLRALDDGEPLLKELFRATLAAGGNPVTQTEYDWSYYLLYKYGNDAQLDFINPEKEWVVERADVLFATCATARCWRMVRCFIEMVVS